MAKGYRQGFFKPKFPKKYVGDPTNIIFRSSWEAYVMKSLDENTAVLKWGAEEIAIPYISPMDNRTHRYFVDFFIEALGKDGSIKKFLVEVKPAFQTIPPTIQKRKTKKYINEVMTYGVNQAKWEAANKFCEINGWEFKLLTEKNLFQKNK